MYAFYQLGAPRFPVGTDKQFPYIPINPPTTLPFTLDEVKNFIKFVDPGDGSQDALITSMIRVASDFCQKYTKITFFTTEFVTYRDYFTWTFQLRKYPVQQDSYTVGPITTAAIVEYLVDRIFTPVDPTLYFLTYAYLAYPYIELWPDSLWPTNYTTSFFRDQSVKITFKAGLGDDATAIPDGLKIGMLNHIAAMYENRGDCSNCDASTCANLLPVESRNEYNIYKIISVGPSRT